MSASDIQDSVHQAVDLAFGVADLLGSFFGAETEEERRKIKHVLHADANGSEVTLTLNTQNQPIISCTGPSTTYATVVPVTTQDQSYPQPQPMQGQLSAQPVTIQGGTQLLFNNFPNFTQGMVTATQIDTTQSTQTVGLPIAAATLRNFSSNLATGNGQQSIPLATQTTAASPPTTTPLLTATMNNQSITVINNDANYPYTYAATVTTAAPTQTFTLIGVVGPNAQYTSSFPPGVSAPVISEITLIVSSYPGQGYTYSATPGSQPIPPSA